MRRMALLGLFLAFVIVGCGKATYLTGADDEPAGTTTPPEPLACDYCVDTAPATYTGPSQFWRGKADLAPDCPDPTPLRGIEGFLTDPSPQIDFVRECRITPSDTCETEGKVCAPLPDEGYSTCVHHVDDVGCPDEYGDRRDIVLGVEDGLVFTFTLCCTESPEPT